MGIVPEIPASSAILICGKTKSENEVGIVDLNNIRQLRRSTSIEAHHCRVIGACGSGDPGAMRVRNKAAEPFVRGRENAPFGLSRR